MSRNSQYGHPLILNGLDPGSSAERLRPIHLSTTASECNLYDEAWLQRLIMRHPSVLPVDQVEPVFTPLIPVCIELPMNVGNLDNLLVTPAGDLVLVECKLWRNPEARRQVIAQILDYATEMCSWTYENLQRAIDKTRPLNASTSTRKLFELAAASGELDEASFHDAVSRNLKRGRFLLRIVGDGIREDAEGMVEFLQRHAGFHFTFGLVELAIFETPDKQYVVQPRVLAKTTNIERAIVRLEDGHITVVPSGAASGQGKIAVRQTTITEERYFEELETAVPGSSGHLSQFLEGLAAYDIHPEFGSDSLILRWPQEDGRNWNLGKISTHASLFMDYLGAQATSAGFGELHRAYVTEIAGLAPGAQPKKSARGNSWNVYLNGKCVTVDVLLADPSRRDGWVCAIKQFQDAVLSMSEDHCEAK